jgi:hypothetical protein
MNNRSTLGAALLGALLLASAGAHAKCTVTLKLTNNDRHEITVLGNDSQARVNGGTWSKMGFNDVTLAPGATGNATWTTNLSCGGNAKRDLRFKFQDSGDGNKYQKTVNNLDIEDGLSYSYSFKND